MKKLDKVIAAAAVGVVVLSNVDQTGVSIFADMAEDTMDEELLSKFNGDGEEPEETTEESTESKEDKTEEITEGSTEGKNETSEESSEESSEEATEVVTEEDISENITEAITENSTEKSTEAKTDGVTKESTEDESGTKEGKEEDNSISLKAVGYSDAGVSNSILYYSPQSGTVTLEVGGNSVSKVNGVAVQNGSVTLNIKDIIDADGLVKSLSAEYSNKGKIKTSLVKINNLSGVTSKPQGDSVNYVGETKFVCKTATEGTVDIEVEDGTKSLTVSSEKSKTYENPTGTVSVPLKDLGVEKDGYYSVVVKMQLFSGAEATKELDVYVGEPSFGYKVGTSCKVDGDIVIDKDASVTITGTGHPSVDGSYVLRGYDDLGENIMSLPLTSGKKGVSVLLPESGYYYIECGESIYSLTGEGDKPVHFVLDKENPVISRCVITLNGSSVDLDKTGGSYSSMSLLEADFQDDIKIDKVVLTVNGDSRELSFDKGSHSISLSSSEITSVVSKEPADSVYNISLEVYDELGKSSKISSGKIQIDLSAPSISNVKLSGEKILKGSIGYFKSAPKLNIRVEDSISGLKSARVISSEGTESVLSSGDNIISLTGGSYTVEAIDNANNTVVKKLSELGEGIPDNIVVDSKAPEIFVPETFGEWQKDASDIDFKVSDNIGVGSVKASLNGKEIYSYTPEGSTEKNVESKINLIESTNGEEAYEYSIEIESEDLAGNKSETVKRDVKIDHSKPTINSVKLIGEREVSGGIMYFKKKPTIEVSASDTGSGVCDIAIYDGDSIVSENALPTGTYSVQVTDRVGNATRSIPISEFIPEKVSKIVVDEEAPIIKVGGTILSEGKWQKNDVIFNFEFEDNVEIKEGTIKLNGTIVENILGKFKATSVNTKDYVPAADGSYTVEVELKDYSGNVSSWSDTVFVDKTAPTVSKIVFNGEGNKEDVKDGYGYFFDGYTSCDVYVTDGNAGSGVKCVKVVATKSDGKSTENLIEVSGGVAVYSIPKNFKGNISITAIDEVGNESAPVKPSGIISEDNNIFSNSVGIMITLPKAKAKSKSGKDLYSKNVSAELRVQSTFSGIKEISWGIGSETKGTAKVDKNGKVTGGLNVLEEDGNLVVDVSKEIKVKDSSNDIELWAEVTDRVGKKSRVSREFCIDKDSPELKVTFDKISDSNTYNTQRTAKISVKDSNFNKKGVTISGNKGSLGSWSKKGDSWVNIITFTTDGEYQFSVSCEDLAGNVSKTVKIDKFSIDRTAPQANISWNITNPSGYYNSSRTATISVKEAHFNPGSIKVEGGAVSGWSSNGDSHTATVSFAGDGTHSLKVSGSDAAGNTMASYSSESFNIDLEAPKISIDGVQDGVSYKKDAGLKVSLQDMALDTGSSSVRLVGRRNGEVELTGGLGLSGGTLSFDSIPREEKYDDLYTLTVSAVDKAGSKQEEEVTFSINRFGSSYRFESADVLNSYLNQVDNITIGEFNVDEVNLLGENVVVYRNGDKLDIPQNLITTENKGIEEGKHHYLYTVDKSVFDKDGKYLVQVFSESADGTKSDSANEEYSFILDSTPADIIISGIQDKGVYNGNSKKATIEVKDSIGVDNVSIMLNNQEVSPEKEGDLYVVNLPEKSSTQKLYVKAVDKSGNESTREVSDVLVTSNKMVYLFNQLWFKILAGLVGVGAALAFVLRFLVFKKNK